MKVKIKPKKINGSKASISRVTGFCALLVIVILAVYVTKSHGSLVAAQSTPPPLPPPPGYSSSEKIFDDRFGGPTINSARWNTYITGNGTSGAPWNPNGQGGSGDCPGGYDAEYFEPSQLTVKQGLSITASLSSIQSGCPWTSGVISTYGKFQFEGGYVQIRAQMPPGPGMWGSLWMLPGPGAGKVGDNYEIDEFEGGFIGNNVSVNYNASWRLHLPGQQYGGVYNTGVNLTKGYHVYGLQWIAGNQIVWYLDGKQFAKLTSPQYPIPNEPMELLLDLAVANSSASNWHRVYSPTTPASNVMKVAEVQVYK